MANRTVVVLDNNAQNGVRAMTVSDTPVDGSGNSLLVTLGGSTKIWAGSAVTAGGVATFFPTSDGTGAGSPLFGAINHALALPSLNTATVVDVPTAAVKLVAADRKSVTVNVFRGTTLLALGATVRFAADGTSVTLFLAGT